MLDLIYLYSIVGAKNGLNIQTVLSGSGVSTNYVALGGTLDANTTITGAAFNLTLTGLGSYSSSSVNTSIISSGTNALSSSSLQLLASSTFNLRTPAVLTATASSGQYLRLNNQVSGSCEWEDLPKTKHIEDFLIADWVAQRITITAATHGMGTFPSVQVHNGVASWIVILPLGIGNPLVEVKMQGNGDVELLSTVGLEFNGRVIIT